MFFGQIKAALYTSPTLRFCNFEDNLVESNLLVKMIVPHFAPKTENLGSGLILR